ncbi:MAG: UDP-glucose 4-epimerase [Gammaproteobacteria bacterium HGW-Gammaproteobacteria-3]|nr:MAG: UDP-glucose 4-epimerase [Gammaproteobacteria bacterium HGW-Gammaproteobacteria-3]
MTRILITGVNGFVGEALSRHLLVSGFDVVGSVRSNTAHSQHLPCFAVGDIDVGTQWRQALHGVDVVIHLAARVHVLKETAPDALSAFRQVNRMATENLARQCAAQGVRRFIYLSTIKVNGEQSDKAYSDDDKPKPQDAYALSKWEAEQALTTISADTGLEIVIVRPPLVYGPGVKGNFLRLLRWVHSGFPLPFAKVENARSMIGLDNLCDFIKVCIDHPEASGEVFLVADESALATPDLIRIMAKAMKRKPRLPAVPTQGLYVMGMLCGRRLEVERLCGSLTVDSQKAGDLLGWKPPFSMESEIEKTVAWFTGELH